MTLVVSILAITAQPLLQCPLFFSQAKIWLLIPLEVCGNATSISPRRALSQCSDVNLLWLLSKNTPIDRMRRLLSYNTNSSQTAAVPSQHVRPGTGCELRDTFGRRDSDFLDTRKCPRFKDQSEKPHRGRRLIEQEKPGGGKCSK